LICLHISDSAAYSSSISFSHIGYGLPVLLSDVECSSAELQLSYCNHTRFSGTLITRQIGVRCQTNTESKVIIILLLSDPERHIASYWYAIYTAVPGAPLGVQIFNITSFTISLTWSPPLASERHGLSIFGYIINCSADHSSLGNSNLHTEGHNATFVDLHPFTPYNCCVAANSSNGRGRFACLRAVTRK
jgi:hypothetical protein